MSLGKPCGTSKSVRHLRGVVDQVAQHRRLALGELAIEIAIERLAVDRGIGGDDLERGGIGRERQVAVGIERLRVAALVPGFVERGEAGELRRHGLLDLGLDLHAPGVGFAQALAQDEADGALDVVALLQRASRFR